MYGRGRETVEMLEFHLACEPGQKQLISEAVDMTDAWGLETVTFY